MGNTYGHKVVVPLTNKSGGAVIAGDVVIVDTANNEAFTTTTSAGSLAAIGVVQESIANNATGRVLTEGYAALVNVNASVTRGNYGKTHTVAKQATDAGSSRAAGTFCRFLTGGTTPTAYVYPVDLAGAALSNPMTTAEDIIYGGASGTPTRKAIGAAGGALSSINGALAYNSGTSFPGSAVTGDRYWRTDLGVECYYDGTRWVTTQLYIMEVPPADALIPISATSGLFRAAVPMAGSKDIWMIDAWCSFFVNGGTALSASHKWVGVFSDRPGATAHATFTIDSGASSTYRTTGAVVIGALVGTSDFMFDCSWTKTGTPGTLFAAMQLRYRVVYT
jgi:hypothetical protein